MEPKRSKYDTNPLDPDYVRDTEQVWGEGSEGPHTQEVKGATREVGSGSSNENARQNVYSEAPTRRYDNQSPDSSYPSIFVPPTYSPPAPYQPPMVPFGQFDQRPTSRTVRGIGLPEKWAMVLPYTPFYIGIVPALLELFLVPRSEAKVRFHAAQGLALHTAILAIRLLFDIVGAITGTSIGGTLFKLSALIFLILSMVRVWKGRPHDVAPLTEPAQWFNGHIEPRNKF
jgi:uncharacterized membrane protein